MDTIEDRTHVKVQISTSSIPLLRALIDRIIQPQVSGRADIAGLREGPGANYEVSFTMEVGAPPNSNVHEGELDNLLRNSKVSVLDSRHVPSSENNHAPENDPLAASREWAKEEAGPQLASGLSNDATLGKLDDLPDAAIATSKLTSRQWEVLRLLAHGATNGEISGALHISANTVKTHVRNLMAKLNTANRTQTALAGRTILQGARSSSTKKTAII